MEDPDAAEEEAAEEEAAEPRPWWVYVLLSVDGRRTYVGITLDLTRRLAQHNGELPGGARATRPGRPWRIGNCFGPFSDRGAATRCERAVKRLRGRARLRFSPEDP